MATDKWVARLEAKIDLLLEKAGIKPDEVKGTEAAIAPAAPRELTELEQQAIDNAPKTPTADSGLLTADRRSRVNPATNAPDTSSSVPATEVAATGEPWAGYNDQSVSDINARFATMDAAGRQRVLAYERANKKRNSVISTYVNWNS